LEDTRIDGLLNMLDAIQDAAERDGFPVYQKSRAS
jgi:hypothetical protein